MCCCFLVGSMCCLYSKCVCMNVCMLILWVSAGDFQIPWSLSCWWLWAACDGCWEPSSSSLQEQQGLLTVVTPSVPRIFRFLNFYLVTFSTVTQNWLWTHSVGFSGYLSASVSKELRLQAVCHYDQSLNFMLLVFPVSKEEGKLTSE